LREKKFTKNAGVEAGAATLGAPWGSIYIDYEITVLSQLRANAEMAAFQAKALLQHFHHQP